DGVLAVPGAVLAKFELALAVPPVLVRGVVAPFALRALEKEFDADVAGHGGLPIRQISVAGSPGSVQGASCACRADANVRSARGIALGECGVGIAAAYFTTAVTTPAPTVRPPSRIANRRPSSIAIGLINSTDNSTLSPGITISTPSGNEHTPVTSVVRK